MLYIYAKQITPGLVQLMSNLEAVRLRSFDGMYLYQHGKRVTLTENDTIICWGSNIPKLPNVKQVINGTSKWQDDTDVCLPTMPTARSVGIQACTRYYPKDLNSDKRFYFSTPLGDALKLKGFIPTLGGAYITTYIPFQKQYRVHIMDGNVLSATSNNKVNAEYKAIYNYGISAPQDVLDYIPQMAQILGIQFGEFTLLHAPKPSNSPILRKIVTAPTLTPSLVEWYTLGFLGLLNPKPKLVPEVKLDMESPF